MARSTKEWIDGRDKPELYSTVSLATDAFALVCTKTEGVEEAGTTPHQSSLLLAHQKQKSSSQSEDDNKEATVQQST